MKDLSMYAVTAALIITMAALFTVSGYRSQAESELRLVRAELRYAERIADAYQEALKAVHRGWPDAVKAWVESLPEGRRITLDEISFDGIGQIGQRRDILRLQELLKDIDREQDGDRTPLSPESEAL
jgi:hypothetical protein